MKCQICKTKAAAIKRPKTGQAVCKECFIYIFEEEIHHTIISNDLFKPGQKIALGASGGKDSTVLIHVLTTLNKRYKYGIELILLSIDEGITGYRDDSLETVQDNHKTYGLPLKILSYKDIYGWSMDEIVALIGKTNNCTYCGVFRRQALDRGAFLLGVDKIATGHNADDIAETVLMNTLRGDHFRLRKCTEIVSGKDDEMPRCKPLKYCYEKEIVMYAFHLKLVYFATECVYAPNAYRGNVREFLKNLELIRPSAIIDVIHSGEYLHVDSKAVKTPQKRKCKKCGFVSSNELCKACVLLGNLAKLVAKVKVEMEEVKENKEEKGCETGGHECCSKKLEKKEVDESEKGVKKASLHQMPAGGLEW